MIAIQSHLPRVLMLPFPPADKTTEIVVVTPGKNEIREEVLQAFAEHAAVRPYLLAGDMGGLEILAVDGESAEKLGGHAAALAAIYSDKSPEELAKLVKAEQARVLAESRALAELQERASRIQTEDQERI